MNKQLSDLSDEDQRVLLSILVSRREEPICQCVTLEMSAPNSFNAGTIDIVASCPSLKTIATDQSNDPLSPQTQSPAAGGALCHAVPALVRPGIPGVLHCGVQHHTKVSCISCILTPTERRNQNLYLGELLACYAVLRHKGIKSKVFTFKRDF